MLNSKVVELKDNYPSDPDSIDTSPNTINTLFHAIDDATREQMAFLSLAELKNLSPQELEEHLSSQPIRKDVTDAYSEEIKVIPEIRQAKRRLGETPEGLGPTVETGVIGSLFEGLVNEDSWMYLSKAKPV